MVSCRVTRTDGIDGIDGAESERKCWRGGGAGICLRSSRTSDGILDLGAELLGNQYCSDKYDFTVSNKLGVGSLTGTNFIR